MAGTGRGEQDGDCTAEVDVRLLGPVRILKCDIELCVGGPGPRTLLAVLAGRAGTVVTMEELVAALWGERPPKTADGGVYTYVSLLRKTLAPNQARPARTGLLTSSRAGYCLKVPMAAVDLHRFEAAAARARDCWANQDPASALEQCDAALAEWSGPPLGAASGPFADAERTRLELLRLDAQELRCAALLETGSATAAATELARLAGRNPLRERLHELLMLALYRAGRQADALQAYQAARQHLVDELGIEPGPALRRMQQLVLDATENQDTLASVATPPSATAQSDTGRSGGSPAASSSTAASSRRRAAVVPAQLPHAVAAFVGRQEEERQLEQLCVAADEDRRGRAVVISAIDGMGGVGKTALAIHFAHRQAGSFPDGQLFVDLRGFDPRLAPVTSGDALGHLLRGLGADVDRLHDGDIAAQAALYRSLLAGRRVLVVLDNAASAEQVRPLLPGSPGCVALVTSRNRLAGLAVRDGAVRLSLGMLQPQASVELLRRSLDSDAVTSNPDELRELAALCGHLPLALRIAVDRITNGGHYALADMVRQLRAESERLDALSHEDDESTAIRAVFSWSYQALGPGQARAFRLLGLHPRVEFGTQEAAALLGCSPAAAEAQLSCLINRHLLEQPARDGYRFHDLIRTFAAECAERDESAHTARSAVERLLHWFLGSIAVVRETVAPALGEIDVPELGTQVPQLVVHTYEEAICWADRMLTTAADVLRLAISRGFDAPSAQLACALGALFHCTSRWTEWLRVIEQGQAAARRSGDQLSEARLDNDRGLAYHFLGQHDEAVACHSAAVDILTRLDGTCSQAVTANLAVAYSMMGRHLDALPLLERALEISRRQGNEFVEAAVCDSLDAALSRLDRHEEAIAYGRRAVELMRNLGAEHMLGHALVQVGQSCLRAGQASEAIEHLGQALDLWRGLDNPWGEINSVQALAAAYQLAGDPQRARELLIDALALMPDTACLTTEEREANRILTLLDELPH